jgi:uncharacterized protein (DUF362 family)/Pyruvate/2-oxoacid:ferredoxin oxidoreductase delta subunit
MVIVKNSSYEYKELRTNVFEILSRLDDNLIKEGSKVIIKPNLLTASKQDEAITTHPLVIKAVTEYVIAKGGRPQISDSPPMGSFDKIINVCGLKDALHGMPVTIREFKTSKPVQTEGKFKNIELSADVLEADVIINLPKLKTHSQMGLTLAVKNLFGCVIGIKKPQWHYRVGENKNLFAELLVTIYKILSPSINLMDGILAMEGDGPGTGGTPRHIGVLIGSNDALSMDMLVCEMLGIKPLSIPINKIADKMGLAKDFTVSGKVPAVKDFIMPSSTDLLFGPKFAHKLLRRHLTSKPVNIKNACKLCNECVKMCPAEALKNHGKHLEFDYERCIRCYCCLEICPHAAMKKQEPFLKKTLERFWDLRYR